MKKIKWTLFVITFLMIFIPNVHAANIKTYVNGTNSIYPGDNIKVSVGVSGAPLLYGFTGKISYDTSKLKLQKSSGLSGFSVLLGQNLTADSASGKKGSFSFLELVFVPTSNFKSGERTTISFSNVETSDGENTLSCTNSSLTVTMQTPKSKNNYLSSLKVDKGNINFNKNKDTYSIVVENDVTKVVIDGKAEDNKAKVTGLGTKNLNVYENTFKIVVTSESGAKKTYTIVVTRKDEEGKTTKPKTETVKPALDGLTIEGYDLKFDKSLYDYTIQLKDDDTKLNFVPSYDKTKYTYNITVPDTYVVGENLVKITLKDKDGNESEYSIIVFKKEVVKETPVSEDKCKCIDTPCSYKKYFLIENIILIITLVTLFIFSILKKSKAKNRLNNQI